MARKAVTVEILGDAKGFQNALSQAETRTGGFQKKMESVRNKLAGGGAAMTALVTVPLVGFFNDSITKASDLVEANSFLETVFKRLGPAAKESIGVLPSYYGITKTAATEFTASLGLQLQQLGMTEDLTLKNSDALVRLAGDWASAKNVEPQVFLDAVASALRGEYDSLQQFIPAANAASVEQEALAITGKKAKGELTELDKATALLAIVQRDSAGIAGDAERTQGTLAGQLRQQKVDVEALQTSIGEKLIPIKQKLLEVAGGLLDKFNELSPGMQNLAIFAAMMAAALGPVALGLSAVASVITIAATPAVAGLAAALWGLATNPVVLAVSALALLVAGLVTAYQESETFRAAVDFVADILQVGFATAAKAALVVIQQLVGGVLLLAEQFLTLAAAAAGWTTPAGQALREVREDVGATRVKVNDEITAIIKQVDIYANAHIQQAMANLNQVRNFVWELDGKTINIRTRVDTGNITPGFRQHGGPVLPRQLYVVGERGPELFAPGVRGQIIPADVSERLTAAFAQARDATGIDVEGLLRSIFGLARGSLRLAGRAGRARVGGGTTVININGVIATDHQKLREVVMRAQRDYERTGGVYTIGNVRR